MSSVPISRQARSPIRVSQFTRNGLVPAADFQALLAESTGFAARYRTKLVFSRSCTIAGIPNSTPGERTRWRFAFDSSAYVDTLLVFMEFAPSSIPVTVAPYGLLEICPIGTSDGSEGAAVGQARIDWGGSNGLLSDVPRNFGGTFSVLVDPADGHTPVSLTPLTAYAGRIKDVNFARLISCSVIELTLAPDTDDGYPRTGVRSGQPIYDEDRLAVARMQRNLWNYGGQSLWNYTTEVSSSAPVSAPTAAISGQLVQSIGGFTLSATGTASTSTPTFQGVTTFYSSTSADITVVWPTHQSGDIAYLVAISQGDPLNLVSGHGFTSMGAMGALTTNGVVLHMEMWWKRATSSSMSSPVIDFTDLAGSLLCGAMLTVRGAVASGTPHESVQGSFSASSGEITLNDGADTTGANRLVVGVAVTSLYEATGGAHSIDDLANASLASVTQRLQDTVEESAEETSLYRGIMIATGTLASAGAPGNWTVSTDADGYEGFSFAVKP